ncbi:hypothetical protein H310_07393 [Aphanomyces invadans]|uniref:Uncharacterized protein n=1 Tax=Aphanomyces invadans TaxID=157072 RepID=A0A024U5J8_9STRA|nr:hypothetical protein H310_07393 [Aphanomyces invadans]ETW00873.1 hypothetical protein H310_07393 [Aphanomyces invadans]|eukprot:XP_008871008.1 hypothetical protein H310_07393 [Aphanomyces invadans]
MPAGEYSRRPIPCDNSLEVIAVLTSTLLTATDKISVLQRLWGILHLDKATVTSMAETTLPVLLQMRLSSPEVNYWLAAVLEAFTASTSVIIHKLPARDAVLTMLAKLLRVPDPMNAFVLSKCNAANAIANLIQVGGEQAAQLIATDYSVAIVSSLCALLSLKNECSQVACLRALWRLVFHCPHVRGTVSSHLENMSEFQSNKDIVRITEELRPLLVQPEKPIK